MRTRRARFVIALSLIWLAAMPVGAEPPPPKAEAPAQVKVNDAVVFEFVHGDGVRSPAERAKLANQALARVFKEGESETRLERRAGSIVVQAGKVALYELWPRDAGEQELGVYAAGIEERTQEALTSERRRTDLAHTVLSVSLVVFFGLAALYVLRRIGEFADRARIWIDENPGRLSGIRLQTFDVVGPAAVRGGVTAMLVVGRWLLQFSVVYVWLVFTLSLFAPTRPYTQRLTGFVLTPLSDLTVRLAATLPLLLVAFVSGVAVYVLLRFVRLFFASVARGETKVHWLSADLAHATSILVSVGIVVTTLVFAAPVVTGDPEGALARTGGVLLLALGLSLTPLLATGLLGVLVVFGRRLRVGQRIEVAAHRGRVRDLTLLELRLVADDGAEIRLPHLFSLFHATRVLGELERIEVTLTLSPAAAHTQVRSVLLEAASKLGQDPSVELCDLDADAAVYRVAVYTRENALMRVDESDLRIALVDALSLSGLGLGRARGTERAPRPR